MSDILPRIQPYAGFFRNAVTTNSIAETVRRRRCGIHQRMELFLRTTSVLRRWAALKWGWFSTIWKTLKRRGCLLLKKLETGAGSRQPLNGETVTVGNQAESSSTERTRDRQTTPPKSVENRSHISVLYIHERAQFITDKRWDTCLHYMQWRNRM